MKVLSLFRSVSINSIALVITLSITACGGGGSGGGPVGPGGNDGGDDSSPGRGVAAVLMPADVSFDGYLESREKISFAYPSHWKKQTGYGESGVLVSFVEPLQYFDDAYQENVSIVKADSFTGLIEGVDDIQEISRRQVVVAGLAGEEFIFDGNSSEPGEVTLRLMLINFEVNGYKYGLIYKSERDSFDRNVELIRYMVRSMEIGQVLFDGYSLTSDLTEPGKPAIASNGENFLLITCREKSDNRNDYDLIGRIVFTDRTMGQEFVVASDVDTGNTGCTYTSPRLVYAGSQYLLVYMAYLNGARSIVAKRINGTGEILDANPIVISSDSNSSSYMPDVVFDGSRSLVVWHESAGEADDIKGIFINSEGAISAGFSIAENLQQTYTDPNIFAYQPKVAYGNNGFFVTWSPYFSRDTRSGFPRSIYGQKLDLSGVLQLAEPLLIRQDYGDNPRYVDVASDGENYVVGWVEGLLETNTLSAGSFGVYARRISGAGEIINGDYSDPGAQVAAPIYRVGSIDREIPKDFLDVSFDGEKYVFLWSSVGGSDGVGVYTVSTSPDLNNITRPITVGGKRGDCSSTCYNQPREATIAYSSNGALVAWVDNSLGAWFYNKGDSLGGSWRLEDNETSLPPLVSLATANLDADNVPKFFSLLYEFTSLGVQLSRELNLEAYVPAFDVTNDGVDTAYCVGGGSYQTTVTDGGKKVRQVFSDCRQGSGVTINGVLVVEFSDVDADSVYRISSQWDSYSIQSGSETLSLDGVVDYNVSVLGLFDPQVVVNLTASDPQIGSFSAQDLEYQVAYDYRSGLANAYNYSGYINYDAYGVVDVYSKPGSGAIDLYGNNGAAVAISFAESYAEIIYSQDVSLGAISGVRIPMSDLLGDSINFFSLGNSSPETVSIYDFADFGVDPRVKGWYQQQYTGVSRIPYEFDVIGTITDIDGDLLTYQVTLDQVLQIDDRGEPNDGAVLVADSYIIEKTGFSSFQLIAQNPGQYTLRVTASDSAGLISGPQYIVITILPDTDGDGFLDNDEYDDDNDGYDDFEDAFPKDALEWLDFDRDGMGDNSDSDDDNDGYADFSDQYPFNANCAELVEGDGVDCYIELISDWKVLFDGAILYFYQPGRNDIARWDVGSNGFIEPLISGGVLVDSELTASVYSKEHNRLYMGFDSGDITYIDLLATETEQLFITTARRIEFLIDADNFLLAFHEDEVFFSKADIAVFDVMGNLTATVTGRMPRQNGQDYRNYTTFIDEGYFYDSAQNIYYDSFDDGDLDLITGLIVAEKTKIESPPIASSPDGSLSLRANSEIYDINTGVIVSELTGYHFSDFSPGQTVWTNDGISYLRGENYYRVDYLGNLLEKYELPVQSPIALYEYGSELIVVGNESNNDAVGYRQLVILRIVPSDDSDGDGIDNLSDDYPNDPAASIDDDRDGYPDVWNPGYVASNIDEFLLLDAYPGAVDCYLPEHGDSVTCDPSTNIGYPASESENVAMSDGGILYMWSGQLIHRYSLIDNQYLPSIYVGTSDPYIDYQFRPQIFEYSSADNIIYLGYGSYMQKVTTIDLNAGVDESSLMALDLTPSDILITDNYVVVAVDSIDIARMYYDKSGSFVQQSKEPFRVENMAWDPGSNLIYTSRWPYDIFVEDIDPGDFTGEATLLAEIENDGPLLELSPDGQYFIRSGGNIYLASNGSMHAQLNQYLYDAEWLSNGNLAVLTWGNLRVYDNNFAEIRVIPFDPSEGPTSSLSVQEFDGQIIVIEGLPGRGYRVSTYPLSELNP